MAASARGPVSTFLCWTKASHDGRFRREQIIFMKDPALAWKPGEMFERFSAQNDLSAD
jgi:hypothetical protein